MDIIQKFYDELSSHYTKLFFDWNESVEEQAELLSKIFSDNGYSKNTRVLDCACGIGTQSIGLASLGYNLVGCDISCEAIDKAKSEAYKRNLEIRFENCDFRYLSQSFKEKFEIIISIDNALPHMLSNEDLKAAIKSIIDQLDKGGMFVASIRDYDALLENKPLYSPPYIHKKDDGQYVSFQTWEWDGDNYKLVQYIIEDENVLKVNKFACEYRATRRSEITELLILFGCNSVEWKFPDETGFYQPIVIAKK